MSCRQRTGIFFTGNAPSADSSALLDDDNATVYYLPGTTGWGPTFAGQPTAQWPLPCPLILCGSSFGVQANSFGFVVS
jgi:hypothetical protein